MNASRLLRPTDALVFLVLAGLLGGLGALVFRRHLYASRVAAAQAEVGSLGASTHDAFERSQVTFGGREGPAHTLCRSAQPVPREVSEIRGKSYVHRPEDWTSPGTDERDENRHFLVGFPCLDYAGPVSNVLYFQINYTSDSSPTSPGTAFEATARGDLNGDGILSRIATRGRVRDGNLWLEPSIEVENPEE